MATSVDTAKREQPETPSVVGGGAAAAPAAEGTTLAPGLNPADWINANRIHIKDGSLFIDPYLVIHPKELAPENEAQLRKKLQLTYSINNPSFFESGTRTSIALNLGQLVPVSASAKRSKLMEEVEAFNRQATTGVDAELKKELDDKRAPFAAIARDVVEHPENDPVGVEMLKNSLAVYLLVREKLTQNGYLSKLPDYVQRTGSPEQVLADLERKTGVTPLAFREAALQGGIDGVGRLLGLDPKYISDVKELAEHAATQDFSYNLVEHWHLGRQLQGLKAPLKEKITTGLDARITAKITEYRDRIRHRFEVPTPVAAEEKRIAEALAEVDPIQRELMFRLGYEICFSPEINADDIAFFPGIYGLHRKAANDLRDVNGTYRIYFSGRGVEEDSLRTLVHEVAHNLWPDQFTPAQISKIDQLAQGDHFRFMNFHSMMTLDYASFEKFFNAYKAGNDTEKAAVIAAANEHFARYDFHAEGLFPYLHAAHDFRFAVDYAYKTLSVEGERYNRSGYHSPEERFREVISRFAELKQIKYKGEPEFLQFLAPGLNQVWETEYLPHLARVNQALKEGKPRATATATPQRDDLSTLAVDATSQLVDTAIAPETTTQPKVDPKPVDPTAPILPTEHTPPTVTNVNGTPIATTGGTTHPMSVDSAPSSRVATDSIQLNARTAPALNALTGMGIAQH